MYLKRHKSDEVQATSPGLSHMEAMVMLKEAQGGHVPARGWHGLPFVNNVMYLAWHLSAWAPSESFINASLELGGCSAAPSSRRLPLFLCGKLIR